jgi:hypothetical protein
LVDDVASRLRTQVPSRTVYEHAVPASPASRYLLVASSETRLADTLGDIARMRDSVIWVTSVSRNPDAVQAADEAAWGSEKAADALMGWRTSTGDIAWKPVHLSGQPVQRDDALPDVVMFAVDRYGITYQ